MTISSTLARNDYSGSTSTGPYVYGFKVFAATDLQVIKRTAVGTETTLTYLTDYTVSGAGNDAGGSVTLIAAPLSTDTITIRRHSPITQPASIRNQGSYLPETIEDQLDRAVLIQQQQEDAIERSLKLPPSYNPTGRARHLVPTAGSVVVGDGTGFTTAATSTATAVTLPGASRTVATLSAYLANNAVFNVLDYGASPSASAAVNTAAMNAAAVAAGNTGLLYFPAGQYSTNGPITILGACRADGEAQLNVTGSGDGLHVGNGTTLVQGRTLILPNVSNADKVGLGWTGSGIGVLCRHVYDCEIHVPYVNNFVTGVHFSGLADGADYNSVFLGYLRNNKVNLKISSDATGWCNENNFFGGRLAHDPLELQFPNTTATGQPGVRHVQIIRGGAEILNNHRFWGCSLEGDVPEFHADIQAAHTYFNQCRWETAVNARVRYDGADSLQNRILGGYDANRIAVSQTNGAFNTGVESSDGTRQQAGPADGVYVLSNSDSSGTPILMGLAANQNPLQGATANLAGYSWTISAQTLRGKLTADTQPRVEINFTTGVIKTGNGTVAPVQVVGLRDTGWTAMAGTATKTAASFNTATVTLPQLAQVVKAMLDADLAQGNKGA